MTARSLVVGSLMTVRMNRLTPYMWVATPLLVVVMEWKGKDFCVQLILQGLHVLENNNNAWLTCEQMSEPNWARLAKLLLAKSSH